MIRPRQKRQRFKTFQQPIITGDSLTCVNGLNHRGKDCSRNIKNIKKKGPEFQAPSFFTTHRSGVHQVFLYQGIQRSRRRNNLHCC